MTSWLVRDRSFYRALAGMTLPLTLQALLLISVNTVNSILLGSTGEVEMAAASLASQVFFLYSTLTYGFSISGAILISQYWGKGDMRSIRAVLTLALRCNLLFAAAVTLGVLLFPAAIMRCYSSDARVVAEGASFLRIAAYSYLPFAVSSTLYQCYKGVERARIVAVANIATYGLNIALNWVFIFGKFGLPALGVRGAALGMLLARLFELCLMLWYALRRDKLVRYRPRMLLRRVPPAEKQARALLRRDYFTAVRPVMGHELVWSFGMTASQAIMGQISTSAIAAFNVCYVFFELATAVQNGLSGASTTLIGKTVGNAALPPPEKKARVRAQAYTIMAIATVLGLLGAAMLLLGGGAFAGLYALSARSRGYVASIMPVMAMVTFFSAWEVVGLVGVLRGGGDAKTGFITDVVVMWFIAIPLGLLAAFVWKLSPVWVILLLKLDMPLKGITGLVRVLRMRWVRDLTRGADLSYVKENA